MRSFDLICFAITMGPVTAQTAPGTISTFAGNGAPTYSGDNQAATSAGLNGPSGLALDASGNIYIADSLNNRIRKVDTRGVITTVAGSTSKGFAGDGGAATSAALNNPMGICFDPKGNLYVADSGNFRIRKIDVQNNISTLAGSSMVGSAGDGQAAATATFTLPVRCVSDRVGNLYIADQGANNIRKIDVNGVISTFVGNGRQGFSGDNGPARNASLNKPSDLALNSKGELYVSDQLNDRIRKVGIDGTITTVAGTGLASSSGDGGPPLDAGVSQPTGMTFDGFDNVLYVDGNTRVRSFSPTGAIRTLAGNGTPGFSGDGGPAVNASVSGASAVITDASGQLYISDFNNNRIRKVTQVGLTPFFTTASVVNAASFVPGMTPGGIATIFGAQLTNAVGVVQSNALPVPASVGGTSVTIGGVAAPIFAVANVNGAQQINLQVPYEVAGKDMVPVVITNNGSVTAPILIPVMDTQPGAFVVGAFAAAEHGADNSLIDAAHPAAKGETIVLFATGLGIVSPSPGTGNAATGLASTLAPVMVTIAGQSASVVYSGLTPGDAGLYQVNLTVPQDVPSGNVNLVVTANSIASPVVSVPIK